LLGDILVIAVCAVIAGADSFPQIESFGKAKHEWLKRFLPLPSGIPSHDTFNRLFGALDRTAFAACFARWMAAWCEAAGLKVVAIDGQAVRAAPRDTFSGCLHLVSAWAVENRVILGQAAVADGSNEVAAIPERLQVLELKGALVTIDAAGCQVEIARQIRAKQGHYLLAVKDNQPARHAAVPAVFDRACATDFADLRSDSHGRWEKGHGRLEERYTTVIYDPEGLPPGWPDVAAVVQVGREREVGGQNRSTAHYSITSSRGRASELVRRVRGHWGSRTACTGSWTWPFARTRTARAGGTPGRTSAWCAASLPRC
jgi:predicted transposase YbfD/YdcC